MDALFAEDEEEPTMEESDKNAEESSDEESEENEELQQPMFIKPSFVPKSMRGTLALRDPQNILADAEDDERQQVTEARRIARNRSAVAESLRKSEDIKDLDNFDSDSDAGMPEDVSDYDDDVEYEAWKLRELKRLRRDAEEREAAALEQSELLRRRNMTDEERLIEDRNLGKMTQEEARLNKPKWGFMQKYYHKGVFYMDEDSTKNNKEDVRNKDYASAPTLEDTVDKERLPQVLQVRNFGKKGRTKYTHLLDQDTTVKDKQRVDVRPDQQVMQSYLGKRSAAGNKL